jgi:hypothetical protein
MARSDLERCSICRSPYVLPINILLGQDSLTNSYPIQLLTPQPFKQSSPSVGLSVCHAAQGLRKCGISWSQKDMANDYGAWKPCRTLALARMDLPYRRRDGWGRSWRAGLLSRVCGGARGPFAVEPWAAGAGGVGLSSLFVQLSPSAGDGGVWLARSLALLVPLALVLALCWSCSPPLRWPCCSRRAVAPASCRQPFLPPVPNPQAPVASPSAQ